ncbi:MAG: septum formation initiator family protein [Hyphomicrobiales bacterium]|nr:septum formation initiator family protein [Hyphomicrobiales bacterium]
MFTRQRRRSPIRRIWLPMITAAFLGYFGYHAFNGSYGIPALERMEAETADLKKRLGELRRQRAVLEKRVSYLNPDSLDADILDIEARASLNLLRPDEVVISFGAVQHKPQ